VAELSGNDPPEKVKIVPRSTSGGSLVNVVDSRAANGVESRGPATGTASRERR